MNMHPIRSVLASIALVLIMVMPVSGAEDPTRSDASAGLPQETDSFSTVEVYDSDSDGKDEIYLGGSGFRDGNIRTEGIRAYEFDPSGMSWEPFGSGLPAEGSGLYYGALGLGDVNGDGEMDIAAPIPNRWYDIDQTGVDLYNGDGSGNFALLQRIPLEDGNPGSSNEVEIADMDGDGKDDVIVSTYTGVNVFFGDGSGTNWEEQSPPHLKNTEISGIGIGDLDGDGLLDIVGTPYQRSTDVEMYVQGARRSWRDIPFKDVNAGFGTKVMDMNGDGNADVVYGSLGEGIKVWLGEGRVTVTEFPCTEASTGLPDGGPWDQIELSDIDGDGLPDMIAGNAGEGYVHLYINELPAGWREIFTYADALEVGGDAYGANFGDWDGDGTTDIAACSWEDGANAWLLDKGSGGNRPPTAKAGNDRTANVDTVVTLDGSGSSDPDGTIDGWEWTCTSEPKVNIEDADKQRASFTPSSSGTVRISLKVKDNGGIWSSPDEIVITVIDPNVNERPVADAGDPITGSVGETITLDGSGSRDIDGTIASFEWTSVGGKVRIEDADQEIASFTPAEEGDHSFQLVVTDDEGSRSEPDTVTAHIALKVFYPRIGPFLYESGSPVKGAVASLSSGQKEYTATTDDSGHASFENGIPPGSYDCSLQKDGKFLLDPFTITVKDTGAISVEGGSIPKVKERSSGTSWVVIGIAVGVILLLGMLILLFLLLRKRPETVTVTTAPASIQNCGRCGGRLSYNADFQRYYCNGCKEYK
jgi:hypothetical protein